MTWRSGVRGDTYPAEETDELAGGRWMWQNEQNRDDVCALSSQMERDVVCQPLLLLLLQLL